MPNTRLSATLVICLMLLSACQGGPPPPADQTATADAKALAQSIATAISIAQTATAVQATADAAPTKTPTVTPTPDPFPKPVIGSIYVAEQRFEDGWMFWLQPNTQIWVLTTAADGQNVWSVYDDAFVEGDAESDPQILPPEGFLQPIRGFGKLWRENPEVRLAIGWAVGVELGHTTRYEYHHGGFVDADNNYAPEPGYHQVESLSGDIFKFLEASRSWRIES